MGDVKSIVEIIKRCSQCDVTKCLAALGNINPKLADQALQYFPAHSIGVIFDTQAKRYFIACEYNRDDKNSYRSPWTNMYFPLNDPVTFKMDKEEMYENIRGLEIQFNKLFDLYRKEYFGVGSVGSVFMSQDVHNDILYAGFFIHKEIDVLGFGQAMWDSFHWAEMRVQKSKATHYRLSSTVKVALLVTDEERVGKADLGIYLTRQHERYTKLPETREDKSALPGCVSIVGGMIEESENMLRKQLEHVYSAKTREVIDRLRTLYSSPIFKELFDEVEDDEATESFGSELEG